METKRWQDWVMLVLGTWLFSSPFLLSYGALSGAAAWNCYIVGALVALFAVLALAAPRKRQERVNVLLGLWLIIAPFALNFSETEASAAWNQIVFGVLIAGDAVWALAQRRPGVRA